MKINTYKKALDEGKIKEGDYFEVKYPNGITVLFRLFKTEKGYVMWGPPTAEKVFFRGKEGYDNLFALADSQARNEYANDAFEDVHACSLPEREYNFETYDAFLDAIAKFSKMYDFSDTSAPSYALASRCAQYDCNITNFCLFRVSNGNVHANDLYYSNSDYYYNNSYAVRPEAIPKSTMEFIEECCDGSEGNPWICLGSQEENIPKQSEESTNQDKDIINIDKEELMNFIQEGYNWLKKLEEYAKNLK